MIELLEGKPPYHQLEPMQALFRIVQDDCPPIPEGASPIVKDFLYHCFQKDSNLRVSAKKLLKHPWMISARKHLTATPVPQDKQRARGRLDESGRRPLSNYNFDEALLKVQEWNEALKCQLFVHVPRDSTLITPFYSAPSRPAKRPGRPQSQISPTQSHIDLNSSLLLGPGPPLSSMTSAAKPATKTGLVEKIREPVLVLQPPEEQDDNWDNDFEEGISFSRLHALDKTIQEEEKTEVEDNAETIRPNRSPSLHNVPLAVAPANISPILEDYSDLAGDEDEIFFNGKVADFKVCVPNQCKFRIPDSSSR